MLGFRWEIFSHRTQGGCLSLRNWPASRPALRSRIRRKGMISIVVWKCFSIMAKKSPRCSPGRAWAKRCTGGAVDVTQRQIHLIRRWIACENFSIQTADSGRVSGFAFHRFGERGTKLLKKTGCS